MARETLELGGKEALGLLAGAWAGAATAQRLETLKALAELTPPWAPAAERIVASGLDDASDWVRIEGARWALARAPDALRKRAHGVLLKIVLTPANTPAVRRATSYLQEERKDLGHVLVLLREHAGHADATVRSRIRTMIARIEDRD